MIKPALAVLGGKYGTELVPPETYHLVTDVGPRSNRRSSTSRSNGEARKPIFFRLTLAWIDLELSGLMLRQHSRALSDRGLDWFWFGRRWIVAGFHQAPALVWRPDQSAPVVIKKTERTRSPAKESVSLRFGESDRPSAKSLETAHDMIQIIYVEARSCHESRKRNRRRAVKTMKTAARFIAILIAFLPGVALADDPSYTGGSAPYSGFQTRAIKNLSANDIVEIRRGGGLGLAFPAELSGRPDPAHLLERHDEIGLSLAQIARIETNYADMRADAIDAGERFIAAEAALSAAFESPSVEAARLQELIDTAAASRAALRFVHLSRDLATAKILQAAQVQRYSVLRGYTDDPCSTAPNGHDVELWRQHNGCG